MGAEAIALSMIDSAPAWNRLRLRQAGQARVLASTSSLTAIIFNWQNIVELTA